MDLGREESLKYPSESWGAGVGPGLSWVHPFSTSLDPQHFSEPSIFLYGLECFEGKEIELSGEVRSLQAEGFNNHVLSVRIQGGT